MVRASALYITILVATMLATLTALLITQAFYYRLEAQKAERYKKLRINLDSATTLLLSDDVHYTALQFLDLFGTGSDSISYSKKPWGIYDLVVIKSFIGTDTLSRAFLTGRATEADHTAIYLSDHDRPLSLSGSTKLVGNVILPKAGLKRAHVEGRAYLGTKLVEGSVQVSKGSLPPLDKSRIAGIDSLRDRKSLFPIGLTTANSFAAVEKQFNAGDILANIKLQGYITITSDTVLTIKRSAQLKNVIVYAPAVILEEGFRGSCQIIATDSIISRRNVVFEYPSCLAVITDKSDTSAASQPKIVLGKDNQFNGALLTFDARSGDNLPAMISIGQHSQIKGEVYSSGFLKLDKPVSIFGKVSCSRFIIKTAAALYENYLIDIVINRMRRSEHYLSSNLFFQTGTSENKILKWIK